MAFLGETGAGNGQLSISIDFVLGAKADRNMIRFGQNECSVRAEFFSMTKIFHRA